MAFVSPRLDICYSANTFPVPIQMEKSGFCLEHILTLGLFFLRLCLKLAIRVPADLLAVRYLAPGNGPLSWWKTCL